jgi:hypothetical protein
MEQSLPGFTTPSHIRWGVTGKAKVLFGETTAAQILAGETGKVKELAGATTTAQALGQQLWGRQSWHKASPGETKIRPINTIRIRRMKLTRGQKKESVIADFSAILA